MYLLQDKRVILQNFCHLTATYVVCSRDDSLTNQLAVSLVTAQTTHKLDNSQSTKLANSEQHI